MRRFQDVSRVLRPRGWHLGVAIKVDDGKVDSYYDVAAIARYADWLHIQAFDFHGHWEEFTGLNAPLRWIEGDTKNVVRRPIQNLKCYFKIRIGDTLF